MRPAEIHTHHGLSDDPHLGNEPLGVLQLSGFAVLAALLHLTFHDVRLFGSGQTRVYVTLHELLLTAAFAALLAWPALKLIRARDHSSLSRMATVLLYVVTVGCVYWAFKIVIYPFEADTMEGNNLLQGVVLWDRPSLLYPSPVEERAVAYMYPPLSGILFGSIYRLSGNELFYARLLGFLLIAISGVLLTRLVRLTTQQSYIVFCGWLCLQIFFCGYLYSLRSDALLVFLLTIACLLFRRHLEDPSRMRALIACSFLIFTAMVTKQHAFFVLAAFLATLLLKRDYRGAAVLSTSTVVFYVPFTLWLNAVTHGWYLRTLLLGSHHKLVVGTLSLLTAYAIPMVIFACGIRCASKTFAAKPRFSHPDAWLYGVAAFYVVISLLALMKGGPGSMNNLAFELAILLPATSIVVTRVNWGVAAFSLLLALSLPSFILYQPFAGWLVYAPAPAQQITNEIQRAPGPVLLGRRQEFLLRTGRPVYDDIGDIYFEFVPAGYPQAAARLNREIRSGKYALLMMEPDEFQEMEESTRQFLTSNYRVSADPARAIFQLRLTKLH